MDKRPIERSSDTFRSIDLKAEMERSRRFWASPEGRKAAAETKERQERAIRRNRGFVKFPQLVGTRPAIGGAAEVADWKARLGI